MPQVNRDGASSRGSDASVTQRSPGRQRRVQVRGRHASASRTALYHVVQGRPATSRDRKAIGIVKAQRDRPGGPRHVSVHCATVGRRYSSSVGGTSTGRYVNISLGIPSRFAPVNISGILRELEFLSSLSAARQTRRRWQNTRPRQPRIFRSATLFSSLIDR